MTLNDDALLLTGFVIGAAVLPILALLFGILSISVDEGEVVVVSRFGKLVETLKTPGIRLLLNRPMPWIEVRRISVRREFRNITGVVVNDSRGTTVTVDLFLEFRIEDPVKATFEVVDWERALTSLVSHVVTSALGNRQFEVILSDRNSLANSVQEEIAEETRRWGMRVERLMIRSLTLLP